MINNSDIIRHYDEDNGKNFVFTLSYGRSIQYINQLLLIAQHDYPTLSPADVTVEFFHNRANNKILTISFNLPENTDRLDNYQKSPHDLLRVWS